MRPPKGPYTNLTWLLMSALVVPFNLTFPKLVRRLIALYCPPRRVK